MFYTYIYFVVVVVVLLLLFLCVFLMNEWKNIEAKHYGGESLRQCRPKSRKPS